MNYEIQATSEITVRTTVEIRHKRYTNVAITTAIDANRWGGVGEGSRDRPPEAVTMGNVETVL